MNGYLIRRVVLLAVWLLIALAVWSYYRSRTSSPADRYSTFGPRFWAGLADDCVLWPVSFIAAVVLTSDVSRTVAAVVLVVQSLAWLAYTVVMHALRGQTVGKMVTKVRVVDNRTEGSISWRQALLREGIPILLSFGWLIWQVIHLLDGSWTYGTAVGRGSVAGSRTYWLLSLLPTLWFLAEVLTMLTNVKRRALHDFIAGTVVVRTNTAVEEAAPGGGSDGDSDDDPGLSRMARRTQGWGSEE
jgi:uncharacterized RDD family membrane protein YckC